MAFIAGGGFLGNIALAAIGIGLQLAAQIFFPQKIKGPRAESTKAQTAKYGDYIARVHGHGRTAGAAIWLKNDKVDEHKEVEQQEIFGIGIGPKVTTFTYTADFAVAFAWNGPAAGIPRMWFDDKLGLDRSAESIDDMLDNEQYKGIGVAKGAQILIYVGTADQQPDPDIEADRGVDNVPAWPGLVYAKIKNFPLDEFGIRLPNTEAEVVMAGEIRYISHFPAQQLYQIVDMRGDIAVGNNGSGLIQIFSVPDFTLMSSHDIGGFTGTNAFISATGDIFITIFTAPPVGKVFIFDGHGGGLKQYIEYPRTGLGTFGVFTDYVDEEEALNIVYLHEYPDTTIFTYDAVTSEWSAQTMVSTGTGVLPGPFSAGPDYLYYILYSDNSVRIANRDSPTAFTVESPPGLLGDATALTYDEEVDGVYIFTTQGIFLYSDDLSELIASNTDPTFFTGLVSSAVIATLRIDGGDGTIWLRHNGASGPVNDMLQLNKNDLTEVSRIDFATTATPGWTNVGIGGNWFVNPDFDIVGANGFIAASYWFLPRVARERIQLSEIIAAECEFAGLPYDVSGITGTVEGYVVRDNSPPRGVIEDLARVKFFDFTQANGTTKFFMRQSSVMADAIEIPYDLGFTDSGSAPEPKFVSEEYTDFREIPHRVVLSYPSVDADYRMGAQGNTPPNPAKRDSDGEFPEFPVPPPEEVSGPMGENEGHLPYEFQTSLVMSDDEAAQVVDIFYNELLDSANIYHGTVGPKFLRTHPGDVLSLDLDLDRKGLGVFITRMEGDLAINVDFMRRTTIYTSDAVGVPTPNNPQSLLGISRVAPVFIDGHLFREADDGNQFYVGVYPVQNGTFSSASIYKSTDLGTTYNPWVGFTTSMLRGLADDALPDRPHPASWDYASEIVFFVANDDGVPHHPSSVTEEQILADDFLNLFAVRSEGGEWEYIQAAIVTHDGDGTWTLSTLLRGRRGTEFAMAGHAIGDPVVYIDYDSMGRPADGEKDLARKYVAVATSTTFSTTFAVNFTNTAKGLRPWAPWGISGERDASGNLTIDWIRRDRLGQQWPEDGPEDPPLSETVERYQVYIYSMSAGILRTITVDGDSETPYSAADQTTDFGAPVPVGELMVGVKQYSSTYGYGVEATAMI